MRVLRPQKSSTEQRYGRSEVSKDRLNKMKTLWIPTGTPGDTTEAHKVINDMEMNKDMINHSFIA